MTAPIDVAGGVVDRGRLAMFTGCTVWARATKLSIESYVGASEGSKWHFTGGEVVAKSLVRRVAEL